MFRQQELSTEEAAVLLCVSRAYLDALLEKGEIPYRKIDAYRTVILEDILAFKERNKNARRKTLDELAQLSQDEGMGY
ncbi:helix-turn-helix domain-containing protein [Allohahella marinimesophila]|uniref:Helix-turn-helix domain-containing protein n=1 Tax=Allohahella marinimesophila TaxID=1054972 RepID=A0ABP7NRS8_9GAMM